MRIYQLPYVPIGLWFRVVSRMITLTENKTFQVDLPITLYSKTFVNGHSKIDKKQAC